MADDLFGAMLSGLLGGYLTDRLFRCVRPKKDSKFNSIPYETLKRRNHWIELSTGAIFLGGMLLIFAGILVTDAMHDPWLVGVVFGLPTFLMLLFVGVVTLPKGWERFHEFWRYHELKHRIRLALLLGMYTPVAMLGIVSVFNAFL